MLARANEIANTAISYYINRLRVRCLFPFVGFSQNALVIIDLRPLVEVSSLFMKEG